jgi:hypothetical protein
MMIHLPFQCYMLTDSDSHLLRRRYIDNWWLARVCIGDPKRNGKSVCCPSEVDRQRAHKVEEEGREPCFVG